MSTWTIPLPSIRPTRYHDEETGCRLGYRKDDHELWRVYQSDDGSHWAAVGSQYKSKAELLADLDRYATESWGFV